MKRALSPLVVAAGLALLASCSLVSGSRPSDSDPLEALCRNALLAELAIAAAAVAGSLLGGPQPWRRLGLAAGPARVGGRGLCWLVLGTVALSHALDALLSLSGLGQNGILAEFPGLLAGARGQRLLFAFIALGLAPALAEELLCRGLLQRSLTQRFGPGIGISVAALAFGALHLDPIHGVFAGLLGLYLGAGAHWVGNTWAPIACHAANNLAAIGLAALSWGAPSGPLSLGLGLALAGFCAWRVRRESIWTPPASRPFSDRPDRTTDRGRKL